MSKGKNVRPLAEPEYLALAEFRYQLRRYLRHMEDATRLLGVNPQQYQLVLAVKGLPQGRGSHHQPAGGTDAAQPQQHGRAGGPLRGT